MPYLHVFELVLSTVTASLALLIAYLYWLGILHCRMEGRTILGAIVVTWGAIGAMEIKAVTIEVLAIFEGVPVFDDMHYITTIPTQIGLLAAAIYFIHATVRRNPMPSMETESEAVREGLHDRK